MKIVYRKETGIVVMAGQEVENEALTTVEVADDPRIMQGYLMIYDGKLNFEKNPDMINKEEAETKRIEYLQDVDRLSKAKTLSDLKPILEKLLNK